MKNIAPIFIGLFFSIPAIAKKPSSQRTENAQVVIGNLAQMIGQIGNIIENPHNADNVGSSVSNMVDNIIKITVHAVQNKRIKPSDAHQILEELYTLCKDFDHTIARTIRAKKLMLDLS